MSRVETNSLREGIFGWWHTPAVNCSLHYIICEELLKVIKVKKGIHKDAVNTPTTVRQPYNISSAAV